MKKTILSAFVTTALLAMATSAFALATITSAGSSIGGGSFKASTGVTVKALADTSSYAASSQHSSSTSSNGGKQYGTVSNDATIKSSTAVANGPSEPATTSGLATGVTWQ